MSLDEESGLASLLREGVTDVIGPVALVRRLGPSRVSQFRLSTDASLIKIVISGYIRQLLGFYDQRYEGMLEDSGLP